MSFVQASQLPTQEEIVKLQNALLVSNTERNTSLWLHAIDQFNKSCGISISIELINSFEELETYLYYEIEIPETQVIQISEAQVIQIHEAKSNLVFTLQATKIPIAYAIEVSTAQESESFTTKIPTAQANKVSTAIQVQSQIQNTNKARTSKPSKLKFYIQAHPYSSVMAPFKPPYPPNSLLLASYRKR
ncbi:zinc finger mym-type protein 2-like: PROVISIONAL [Gigaspora margarita]|uniref:Zinc finger mym-type protein 2-like: PROVISIONAL n=1 Tax=Gigaspora margarita TaxID=4874 RepID=A0A8H4AQL2_GIGMA|nr:zinc finger mym-type protein 2-like: PROVISIONAL [Gigaspora margarita]